MQCSVWSCYLYVLGTLLVWLFFWIPERCWKAVGRLRQHNSLLAPFLKRLVGQLWAYILLFLLERPCILKIVTNRCRNIFGFTMRSVAVIMWCFLIAARFFCSLQMYLFQRNGRRKHVSESPGNPDEHFKWNWAGLQGLLWIGRSTHLPVARSRVFQMSEECLCWVCQESKCHEVQLWSILTHTKI